MSSGKRKNSFFTLNDLHSLAAPKVVLLWPPEAVCAECQHQGPLWKKHVVDVLKLATFIFLRVGCYSFTSHNKNKHVITCTKKVTYTPIQSITGSLYRSNSGWSLQLLLQYLLPKNAISPLIGRSHSCSKARRIASAQRDPKAFS